MIDLKYQYLDSIIALSLVTIWPVVFYTLTFSYPVLVMAVMVWMALSVVLRREERARTGLWLQKTKLVIR